MLSVLDSRLLYWLLNVLNGSLLGWLLDVLNSRLLDWLLDVLDLLWLDDGLLDDWLFNHLLDLLDLLLLLLFLLVDNLSLNSLIFSSLGNSFLWKVFGVSLFNWGVVNILVGIDLWDVFGLVFDGIVFSLLLFYWNVFSMDSLFILNISLFIRDVLDSGFTLNWGHLLDGSRDWTLASLLNIRSGELLNLLSLLLNNWYLALINILRDK